MPGFLSPLLGGSDGLLLRNARTNETLADDLQAAFDSAARRKGLLGRTSFPSGSALFIAPCNSIHTFFMRFPIDVLFVTKDGRIAKVRRSVAPWRMTASLRAYATIELPDGALGSLDTKVGDQLVLVSSGT